MKTKITIILASLVALFMGSAFLANGQGTGTITQLQLFKTTTTPYSAITTMTSGKSLYFPFGNATTSSLAVKNLQSCDTIDTDSSGNMTCGTDSGGAGSGNPDFTYNTDIGFGVTGSATTTKTKFTAGIHASGTSQLGTASSTLQTIADALWLPFHTSALLLSDTVGKIMEYTGTTCTNQFVRALSALGVATCESVNLASDVTGTLPVANGGTGWANLQAGGLLYGNGTGAVSTTTQGTGGQILAWLNNIPTWTATTTFSTGLTYSGGAVTCDTASGSVFGCLASADWTTFNSKLTSLGSGFATTTGATITFSSTTKSFNGLTFGQTIVPSASALMFTPTVTGTLDNTGLTNSTISGISLGSSLNAHTVSGSLSGTSYNGSAAVSDWALNMGNANTWTALQKFDKASTTLFSALNGAYFGATATSSFNSAGVLTLITPLAAGSGGTGLSSLGSGVATWLGTPSSANLASALTDETGTGAVVFNDSPVFTTQITSPIITATSTTATSSITNASTTNFRVNGILDFWGTTWNSIATFITWLKTHFSATYPLTYTSGVTAISSDIATSTEYYRWSDRMSIPSATTTDETAKFGSCLESGGKSVTVTKVDTLIASSTLANAIGQGITWNINIGDTTSSTSPNTMFTASKNTNGTSTVQTFTPNGTVTIPSGYCYWFTASQASSSPIGMLYVNLFGNKN